MDRLELIRKINEASNKKDNEKKRIKSNVPDLYPAPESYKNRFPMTEMQSAYFFGKKVTGTGCHTYTEFKIENIDVKRLEDAWNKLIGIHPMLRIKILKNGMQEIQPKMNYIIRKSVVDKEIDLYLNELRMNAAKKVYNVEEYPLYDISVSNCPNGVDIVHFSIDSWVVDGSSAELILEQWKNLYYNPDYNLEEADCSFQDVIYSLDKFKYTDIYHKCERYWRNKLINFRNEPVFEIDNRFIYNEKKSISWDISKEKYTVLKNFSIKNNVLMTPLLLTIFTNVLFDMGASKEFGIICTTQNRPEIHESVDKIVGPFTSSTIFIANSYGAEGLLEKARATQKQLLEDIDHKHVSGISAMKFIEGEYSKNPIPIVFTSRKALIDSTKLSFSSNAIYNITSTPQIYFELHVIQKENGIELVGNYVRDAFVGVDLEKMFQKYCVAIEQLIENSESEVKQFSPTPMQNGILYNKLLPGNSNNGLFYRGFQMESIDINKLTRVVDQIVNLESACKLKLDKRMQKFIVDELSNEHEVRFIDLSSKSDREQKSEIQNFVYDMKSWLRKRTKGPWFCIGVTQCAQDNYILHICLDMLMFDGISIYSFCNKLFELYLQDSDNSRSVDTQDAYLGYLHVREQYANTQRYIEDQKYWENKFRYYKINGLSTEMEKMEYKNYSAKLGLWRNLKSKAGKYKVEPRAILVAAYIEIMKRWNLLDKFQFTVADYVTRDLSNKFSQCIGDTTSLSWIIDGTREIFKDTVVQVNRIINEDLLHAFGNPLKFIYENSKNVRQNQCFNIVFTNCLNAPTNFLEDRKVIDTDAVSSGVALDCVVTEVSYGIEIEWTVLKNVIPDSMSSVMFNEYRILLKELALNDKTWEEGVESVELYVDKQQKAFITHNGNNLSKQIFDKVVYEFNKTDKSYDDTILIQQLFERQANSNPDKIALIADNGTVSYGELNRRANLFAKQLMKIEGNNGLFGVYMTPSSELIITLMAILKAGAAYVPINIHDPLDRAQMVVKNANIKLVITDKTLRKRIDKIDVTIVCAEDLETITSEKDDLNVKKVGATSEDLAYIIFTSGSTGIPKGVMVRHKPVINLIEWAKKEYNFGENDRVISVNPINFDLSVFDIFGMLSYGSSIRIISEEDRHNSFRLIEIMRDEDITFWNSAPAYLQMIVPFFKTKNLTNAKLRLVFLSGDWIPLRLPTKMKETFPSADVISLGGATEATVWSNYFKIEEVKPEYRSIPYGKPIQNARYYILDDELQPCDIGVEGNLFIGGECLSDGYINNQELTRERFVNDPFHEKSGMIMYNTGDLASYFPDGNIEFLGRSDHQVKISGYRIELGEVEAALEKCGLKEPVVVVRSDDIGNKRLVGYVLDEHTGVISDDITEKVKELLPEYMVPTNIYSLKQIPITQNGKVDRKKLIEGSIDEILNGNISAANMQQNESAIEIIGRESEEFVKVSGEMIGKLLCEIIQDILGSNEEIKMDTNLGHIGFGSLQYTLLSAQIAERVGIEINPALFFKYGTPNEIVNFLQINYKENFTMKNTNFEVTSTLDEAAESGKYNTIKQDKNDDMIDEDNIDDTDIAIIGIDCRLPKASNVETFWQNLLDGVLCKVEIPLDRWDYKAIYGGSSEEENVTNVIHANFIDDIKSFDTEFFGITPREAELMDPRQRILLQMVWHTLEDAGYAPSELRGDSVGFFVGATGSDYEKLVCDNRQIDEFSLMGHSKTIIANRINYYYDWHGPSEVVDTACSSSLVAVHRAVESIHSGECSMAVAGGINLIFDPTAHISLDKIGMLSPDGISKTFDSSADGYGRGEGCVLMLLKPAKKAVKDRDNIYAVIKGSAINHGGKANSLTAPNINAQVAVITKAYQKSNVNPSQIGYLETHGTGTVLGDPIEIEAFKESLSILHNKNIENISDEVVLGAVKPNIGHLEPAAGIAGLLKLVLTVKNKVLPPSVYPNVLNPNIKIDNTPLKICKKKQMWKQPRLENGKILRRVGGVSSFGFGGVNAHIVVEEYEKQQTDDKDRNNKVLIFLFSARNKVVLDEMVKNYIEFFNAHKMINLVDTSYTLQVGREYFNHRLAIIADTIDELILKLNKYLQGEDEGILYGNINNDKNKIKYLEPQLQLQNYDNFNEYDLARLWSYGLDIQWKRIWGFNEKLNRISLPLYPFVKKDYWCIAKNNVPKQVVTFEKQSSDSPFINTATVENIVQQSFSLSGKERFIQEHRINGVKVMPGAAYFEYIYAASGFENEIEIHNTTWLQTLSENMLPADIFVDIKDNTTSKEIEFSLSRDGKKSLLCCAKVFPMTNASKNRININVLRDKMKWRYGYTECYDLFENIDISYGEMFRSIRNVWMSKYEMLAEVKCKSFSSKIHMSPSVIDAALQLIVLKRCTNSGGESWYPFSIGKVNYFGNLPANCYVYAKEIKGSGSANIVKFDMCIASQDGEVLLTIEDCVGKKAKSRMPLIYTEKWCDFKFDSEPITSTNEGVTLLLNCSNCDIDTLRGYYINASISASNLYLKSTNLDMIAMDQIMSLEEIMKLMVLNGKCIDRLIYCGSKNTISTNDIFSDIYHASQVYMKGKYRNKLDILIIDRQENPIQSASLRAAIAFGKSVEKENPKLRYMYLQIEKEGTISEKIINKILSARSANIAHEFKYEILYNKLLYSKLLPVTKESSGKLNIISGAPYLITGGAGKLGQYIAKELSRMGAIPVLIGRSRYEGKLKDDINSIKSAVYYSVDVSNLDRVTSVINDIERRCGGLKGIFHCAGLVDDKLLYVKKYEETQAVIKPKVDGTIVLDNATKLCELDFFITFSSLSSVTGNIGQSDYSYANRFMDDFALKRNMYVADKIRKGKTTSISWPMVKDGGMKLDDVILKRMEAESGMEEIRLDELKDILFSNYLDDHIIVAVGEEKIISNYLKQNN